MNEESKLSNWAREQLGGDASPEVLRLLVHISKLPELEQWVPNAGGMNILDVASLGACLSRIDPGHCRSLVTKIVSSIRRRGFPLPDDMAELSAAAALREWATEVRSLPTQNRKTPDFLAELSGISVEVEVTNSSEKQAEVNRKDIATRLVGRLRLASNALRLKVRLLDELSDIEVDAIESSVRKLSIGQSVQHEGRWHVESLPEGSIQPCSDPAWWTSCFAVPAMISTSTTVSLGNEPTIRATQEIDVSWGLSTQSYINALSKKQNADQASGRMPFLVVCDVTQLPGALAWHEANLTAYLSKWSTALTSVLLLRRSIPGLRALRWDYRRYTNPNARLLWSPDIPESGRIEEPFFPA